MKLEGLMYVGISHHSFRPGMPAKIIGITRATPDDKETRDCYKIEYIDGCIDYAVIKDQGYVLMTMDELIDNPPKIID